MANQTKGLDPPVKITEDMAMLATKTTPPMVAFPCLV
jgi:hypothetical protein